MQKHYAQTDEVLYHVGFAATALKGAKLAVLPGDPGRVEVLAKAIGTESRYITSHREYTSWLTYVQGTPVLVCSTGMGGPSVAICLEELARMGIEKVIRVGTTGSIQENVDLGEIIISQASVRLDGTSRHYAPLEFPAVADFEVTAALKAAADEVQAPCHIGITASSDTFWPGQERYDSFTGYVRKDLQGMLKEWQTLGVLNYEMETASLFVVCRALGIQAGAVEGVVAKRTAAERIVPNVYEIAMGYLIPIVQRALQKL